MTTNYSQFNIVTITGRVSHAEVVKYKGSEFLSVTLITTLEDDGCELTVKFTNGNGLLSLFKGGYLPNGRMVTVTGKMTEVRETFTDKDGEIQLLTRPSVKLVNAIVPNGALGPIPGKERRVRTVVKPSQAKAQTEAIAEVNETPDFAEV